MRIRKKTASPAAEPNVPGAVYLPSGLVTGHLVHIDRLALVASSTSNPQSPCRQVYAHRLLTAHGRIPQEQCAKDGVTAVQMDIKIGGVNREVMSQALEQARQGRLHILGKMAEAIDKPRGEFFHTNWTGRGGRVSSTTYNA